MDEPLDRLLDQLCNGDVGAAEQLVLAYEPYLRKAVRRQLPVPLRAKFDSCDVLQSVWADVFRSFREAGRRFANADQLRGFLFVATRNRLVDRIRKHQKTAAREERLDDAGHTYALPSHQPRPSEVAQAGELWERILAHCPEEHRPLVALRRLGHSLAEIAERTGLHQDSVRRVLRTLARRLAFEAPPTSRRPFP